MAVASDSWFAVLVESIPNYQASAFNSKILKANLDGSDSLPALRAAVTGFETVSSEASENITLKSSCITGCATGA